MELRSHKTFSSWWKLVKSIEEEKEKKRKEKGKGEKKLHFIMVSQTLTSHKDLQPGYFRRSVLTE